MGKVFEMSNKLIAFLVFFFFPALLLANDEVQEGLRIMTEVDRRDSGWVDYTVDLTMILSNARGETTEREIQMKSKETEEDGDRTLMVFDTPPDVRGTGLLTYTHFIGEDDQWLYLPALKRIKRIASKNKSGPFMGSEFAYEDLSSQEVSKYSYRYLKDEIMHGEEHFIVERYPLDQNSGYTRQVAWVDKEHYRFQKIQFFDRKNKHLKTLDFYDYRIYDNRIWRANSMIMENHVNKKSTRLVWNNYQFNRGMREQDFNKNALKRVR